jgi:hypothetical protein
LVAVSGTGNILNFAEPIWPDLNGWRSDSLSSLTTEMKDDGLMAGHAGI